MPAGRPKIVIETVIKLLKTGNSIEDICYILEITEEDLEPYRKVIKDNALSENEYLKKRIKRFKRAGLVDSKTIGRIRQAIKGQIADMIMREMGTVEELIGYPIELLYFDFIKKFPDGYDWDNWVDVWHIDHIKPRVQFTTKELRECFDLKNLRPLDKTENMKRGRKQRRDK